MRSWDHQLALVTSLCISLAACDADVQSGETEELSPTQGRISAMAPVVWACPLENWRRGDDDGCDPITTGTRIEIHNRNIRPEYPHGSFALIGYTHEGVKKMQYVQDLNVTPLGQDEPTVEELHKRVRESVRDAEKATEERSPK